MSRFYRPPRETDSRNTRSAVRGFIIIVAVAILLMHIVMLFNFMNIMQGII